MTQTPEIWTPHDYQRRAVEFMITRGSGQLFLDPGMGKTAITLQAIQVLRRAEAVKKVLIIAPLRPVYAVWPVEIAKWINFQHLRISVLHGPGKEKRVHDNAHIHIINPDGLNFLSHEIRKMGTFPYEMLVIDEISMFKNVRSQRFKVLQTIAGKFKRRFGLTGSPAPNSLLDVFGPMLIVDQGATFGTYITRFKSEYFQPVGYGGFTWVLQPGAEDKIHAALANSKGP
jgi:SNF2 family DNA or RNA helicase